MENPLVMGVYCLYYETGDGQFYIGKSTNIHNRYKEHCSDLRNKTHHNSNITYKFNELGVFPTLYIIEEVTNPLILSDREIHWIEVFDSFHNGMNNTNGGDGAFGEGNPNALYLKKVYIDIAKLLAYTDKSYLEISREIGVSDRVVGIISSGKCHTWLQYEVPEVYSAILEKIGSRNSRAHKKEVYEKVFLRLATTTDRISDISKTEGIGHRIVERIASGEYNLWLRDKYPELYSILLAKKGTRRVFAARKDPYPEVLAPDGTTHTFTNAREFANTWGLQQSNVIALVNGKIKTHKGWKLK